jgi:pyridoxamine 5'-phosphate oxidase
MKKNNASLSETTIIANPYKQFDLWYNERLGSDVALPDAVALGTASSDGRVSVRIVLLKEFNEEGFIFYTNYKSKKGNQLAANPNAALTFHWPESGRQVRIEGTVKKVAEKVSSGYFLTRPRESRLAAWASEQSSVIPDRQYLEDKYTYYKNLFSGKDVEKPENWGGFILRPDWFEFWQDGKFRLHDRLTYSKQNNNWIIKRLSP